MSIAVFDPVSFKARYPEFAAVSDATLNLCFTESGLYLSNTNDSPVQNLTRRTMLLNMLTAHIAYLGGKLNIDGMPRPVGRINQADEGSVSVGFEYLIPGTHAWFTQTQYGAAYWQATSSLRGFQYRDRPTVY